MISELRKAGHLTLGKAALLCSFLALSVPLPALGVQQSGTLRSAASLVRSARYDLAAARSSAGSAARPAKGGRLKLTRMRLNSANSRLAQAAKLLASIPASDAAAAPIRKNYNSAVAAAKEIEGIINPSTQPVAGQGSGGRKPGGTAPPTRRPQAGAQPAKRLNYKEEKLLRDARWYLGETQRYTKAPETVVKRIDGGGPAPVHSEVLGALVAADKGVLKHGLAMKNIDALPAANPKVAALRKAIVEAGNKLGALRSRLKAEDARLKKITGMGHYPHYDQDYELVGAFAGRYRDFSSLVQQPEKLARVIEEDGPSVKELQRIAKTYQPLADQKTPAGQRMEKRLLYAFSQRKRFAAELMAYKKTLPSAFEADLAEADRIAKEAVEKKKPLWLQKGGGIDQRFGWAEKKLLVLRAFGEAGARPYVEKLAQTRKRIRASAKALEKEIIANNSLPPDRYKGSDRADLIERATRAWVKLQPGAKVIRACIPSEAWTRDTRWRWSNGSFYKIDSSSLQVQLIVVHEGGLAVIRPINLYKNHLKGDVLTASPMDTADAKLQPGRYLPLSKLKSR